MEKIIFEDYPSTETLVSADNLNKIQDNAENAINGVILYENANGSNENITLNDSVVNYSKLIIEYKSNSINIYNSVEISNPNSKTVNLIGDCENLATYIVLISAYIGINGTSLTWSKHSVAILSTNVEVSTDISYYNLKITKVVGYK